MKCVGLFGRQYPEAPKGLRCEAWKGRKPMPRVTVHRWFLWTIAGQSNWGPLGDDEDCCSNDPPEHSEERQGFYLSPPLCSWLRAMPGDVNSQVLPACCICSRQKHQDSLQQNEECQWIWVWGVGTNSVYYTYTYEQEEGRSKLSSMMKFHLRTKVPKY